MKGSNKILLVKGMEESVDQINVIEYRGLLKKDFV